jgi:hypothetical protein
MLVHPPTRAFIQPLHLPNPPVRFQPCSDIQYPLTSHTSKVPYTVGFVELTNNPTSHRNMRTVNFGLFAMFSYIAMIGATPDAPAEALARRQHISRSYVRSQHMEVLPRLKNSFSSIPCILIDGSEDPICAVCSSAPTCVDVTYVCKELCRVKPDLPGGLPFCPYVTLSDD